MTQALPQRLPHFEGQGKPQGLGIPYSLSLSLLPTPVPNLSPSVVTSLGANRVRDEVVSAPRIDVDTSTIGHLDFTAALPCEHVQHVEKHADEAARYVVEALCPSCSVRMTYLLCDSGWRFLMRLDKARCSTCQGTCHASEVLTIMQVLR